MDKKAEPKLKVEETDLKSIHIEKEDPNKLLNDFLNTYNLRLKVSAFEDENPFVSDGFVLTDKPLLKISVEYK